MADKVPQKQRRNRAFKRLHKPPTYFGVERPLFYFICVGAVGAFNLFNSIPAGIAVFISGFAFGHWVTNSDPAFLKPWKESAALNDHSNLYGVWNETAFLTQSSDVGMILSVPGVDDESLDRSAREYAVKRLEAALKTFGPAFHVYQYLFKSNRPDIPFANYDEPIVEAAIDQRRKFFEAKRDHLYQVEIFYCILLERLLDSTTYKENHNAAA
jgi:hypothetical protein